MIMPEPLTPNLRLEEPDRDTGSPIAHIVESHLSSRDRNRDSSEVCPSTLWEPSFFGLDRVTRFEKAGDEEKREILAGCARNLLNEAYFIEKSGSAYCARMILLAETTEMRQVYSLIAADEATHLQWIRPFVEETDRSRPDGALLGFLGELIGECDANTLAFLVQIILEGWGLHHYRDLSQNCRDAALKQVFHSIYKDEALHHHTGEVVFDPARATRGDDSLIRSSLRTYTEMVRVGPQGVAGVINRVLGGLNRTEAVRLFTELDTERQSRKKLLLLRDLMLGPGREHYVEELEVRDAFIPHSPEVCASYLHEKGP